MADADYLHYGFWLKKTTKDGATTYNEVETFAKATGIDPTGNTDLEMSQVLRLMKVAQLVCM